MAIDSDQSARRRLRSRDNVGAHSIRSRRRSYAGIALAMLAAAVTACTVGSDAVGAPHDAESLSHSAGSGPGVAASTAAASAPTSAGPAICGSRALAGPSTAPKNSVVVATSQSLTAAAASRPAGTTFWLAPGKHTLGTGTYDQVQPRSGQVFIGAPGAIIDGQHRNLYAFGGSSSDVTISHITVQNFGSPGDNNNEGVVNHDAASGWKITYSTVKGNAGAGVFLGDNNSVSNSCLQGNGQYGFSAYRPKGVSNVILDHNEIVGNNTDNWEHRIQGCGCSGGGKFWDTSHATVTNNYVHDNRGVGLWADTNNVNFLFSGNYISENDAEGIMYETSYNAAITNNTFVRNAIVKGPQNPGFPASAIYLSESGSDPRAGKAHGSQFLVSGNLFQNNWSGVVLWENADRFSGSPANSSSGYTTLVNPKATIASCSNKAIIRTKPYIDDCRWKTQNVKVQHNAFDFSRAGVSSRCTVANTCGFNGIFSNYGSYPSWSPYLGDVVEDHITFNQGNKFSQNSYQGPWMFVAHAVGNAVTWSGWRGAPYRQDIDSVTK